MLRGGGRPVGYLAWMRRLNPASMLLVCGSLVFVGCGSDAKSAADPSVAATAAPGATAGAASSETTPAAATGNCGADVVANVTAQETSEAITEIKIIGGCSLLNITTSLADDGIKAALDICDNAAKVAYVGNVSGISVQASSGKEVALGIKDSPCIGAP